MRITLVHNPKAGDRKHGRKQLLAALAGAGHEAIYQSSKERGLKKALRERADLVLVAGGDGTVARVARSLIDSGVPLSVLPLGTANNLARTLGFTASPKEIISGLDAGRKRAFDVGEARAPWGKRHFLEAVGGGLLADYVAMASGKKQKNAHPEHEMTYHVALLRRLAHDHPARQWKLKLDGEDFSDRYLLWEAMNIRSVGPGLELASRAAIHDGRLDFFGLRQRDRPLFIKYLDARIARRASKFPLPLRRFRKLTLTWHGATLHLDDKLWPRKKQAPKTQARIEITVKLSALIILQPA